jgi:hypothetical protein
VALDIKNEGKKNLKKKRLPLKVPPRNVGTFSSLQKF